MPSLINLVGMKFGRWTVAARGGSRWDCICNCGEKRSITTGDLRSGASRSCGCLRRDFPGHTIHGKSGTKEYNAWAGIKKRCQNKRASNYKYYGGRGITICRRWDSFELFFADMGIAPSPQHSIDRIDCDGNYEPNNCRWATIEQQLSNRRDCHFVVYRGQRMTVSEAVRLAGNIVAAAHASGRIRGGWPVDAAVEKPSKPRRAPRTYADYEAAMQGRLP